MVRPCCTSKLMSGGVRPYLDSTTVTEIAPIGSLASLFPATKTGPGSPLTSPPPASGGVVPRNGRGSGVQDTATLFKSESVD